MTQRSLQGKYQYRRRLPHYQKDDRAVFVTFCCGCLDALPEDVRDIVLRHCLHDLGSRAGIHAVVVMPDHVHLLLTPLRDLDRNHFSLVEILQGIKGASAHSLNRVLRRSGPVWEARATPTLVVGGLKIKSNTNVKSSGRGCPLSTTAKEKAMLISEPGLYLMPATTYSPTHFRVQYHRPSGA